MSERVKPEGSYLTPRLENALVADAMRHGILSCSGDASLRDAARTMSLHHVHTIVVTDSAEGIAHLVVRDAQSGRPTGMLSTLDVAGILAWGEA